MNGARQCGFSLLEVLVAFTILALSLGVVMQILSTSLSSATVSGESAKAASLAQSLLAATGIETRLVAGSVSGVHGSSFRWQIDVEPFQAPDAQVPLGTPIPPAALEAWQVSVNVATLETQGTPSRTVTLTTLKSQAIQPPQ